MTILVLVAKPNPVRNISFLCTAFATRGSHPLSLSTCGIMGDRHRATARRACCLCPPLCRFVWQSLSILIQSTSLSTPTCLWMNHTKSKHTKDWIFCPCQVSNQTIHSAIHSSQFKNSRLLRVCVFFCAPPLVPVCCVPLVFFIPSKLN